MLVHGSVLADGKKSACPKYLALGAVPLRIALRDLYSVSFTASTLVTTSFTSSPSISICDNIIELGDAYTTWGHLCFERIRLSRTDNITGGGEELTEDRKPN